MHDGQNIFDPKTAFMGNSWLCQDTLDPLINYGQMEEVLVIGVYNTNARMSEYTYSFDESVGDGGDGDKYLDFLEQELIPSLMSDHKYPIHPKKPRKLAILGSSLGGLISCYAGWTRGNTYQRVGCLSSSFWWNDEDFQGTVMKNNLKMDPKLVIYIDSGDSGASQDGKNETIAVKNKMISKYLFKQGENLYYYLDKGAEHNEYYWGNRFEVPMKFLFQIQYLEPEN